MKDLTRIEPFLGCGIGGVLKAIAGINGAVPIVHGPMSCASGHRIVPLFAGKEPLVPSTAITEIDAVMGTEEKLRLAINKANDIYHPSLVVVILTCGTSLTGELFEPLIESLQTKLNIPIFMVDGSGISGDENFGFRDFHNKFQKYISSNRSVINNEQLDIIGVSPADYGHDQNIYQLIELIKEDLGIEVNHVVYSDININEEAWSQGISVPCGRFWLSHDNPCPAPFGALGTYQWIKYISDLSNFELNKLSKVRYIENKKIIESFVSKFDPTNLRIAIEAESWWAVGLAKFLVEELGSSVILSSDIDAITYQEKFGQLATTLFDTGNYELKMAFEEFKPDVVFGSSYVNSPQWNWVPFWQPIFHVVEPYKSFMGSSGIPLLLSILEKSCKSKC